jgi:hypothetical protein
LYIIIINEHNKGNPFKTWNDAFWYYTWLKENEGSQHCVWMAIIPVTKKRYSSKNQIGLGGFQSNRNGDNSGCRNKFGWGDSYPRC